VASFGADDAGMNITAAPTGLPAAGAEMTFGRHGRRTGMTQPSTPTRPAAISAQGLVREFNGLTAVDHLDLDIGRGEIYGFLGPNGAGKSTTVRVLCTLLSPTAGRAVVAGYDVATQPGKVRLRIGVALQEAALDPKQTGIELLRLQGRLYGLSRSEIDGRLADLGQLIDIGDALGRPIKTYSGGMKRRLDLAAALVHNPEVLFLDEPTSGLDPVSRARMWEEVRRLNRELDMTIFLTTQYLEEADELADRVGIINDGRLVAQGTPDGLKRSIGNDLIVARLDASAARAQEAVADAVPIRGSASSGMATQDTPKTRVATPAPNTPASPASPHRTRHSTKNVAATVVAAAVSSWVDVTAWSPARVTWARASPLRPAVTASSEAAAMG